MKKKFQNLLTSNSNSENIFFNLYNPLKEKVLKLDLREENSEKQENFSSILTEKKSAETDMIILYRSLETLKKNMKNVPNLFDMKKDNNNDNENIIYRRFEHIEFENHYKKEIENIKKEIETNKKNRKEKLENLKEISNKIDDINFNIEFLSDIERFTNIEKLNQNILNEIKKNKEKEKLMKIYLKNSTNNYNNKKLNLKEEIEMNNTNFPLKKLNITNEKDFQLFISKKALEREKSKKELKKLLPNLIEEKNKFMFELNENNLKIKNLNSLKNEKINILYKHYLNLLKEGKDTRAEGLSWIIKEIYLLGKNVLLSFLPEFLDESGINFLFKQAKINIKLMSLDKRLNQLKNEMSKRGIKKMITIIKNDESNENNNNNNENTNYNTFYTYLAKRKSINMNIHEYQKKKKIDKDIYNNLSNIETINQLYVIPPVIKLTDMNRILNNSHHHFTKTQNYIIEEYMNLLNEKENIKKIFHDMKKNEMNRIFNEYLKNDYFKRYKVEKTVVLSALIGEDNIMPELNKQARKAKNYFDSLQKVGMYKNEKVLPKIQKNILKIIKQN